MVIAASLVSLTGTSFLLKVEQDQAVFSIIVQYWFTWEGTLTVIVKVMHWFMYVLIHYWIRWIYNIAVFLLFVLDHTTPLLLHIFVSSHFYYIFLSRPTPGTLLLSRKNVRLSGMFYSFDLSTCNEFRFSALSRREPDSTVSIVSGYGLDDRAIEFRSPTGAKDFSSSLCGQTGSEAHPASCTMGTGGPFPGESAGGEWRWPLTPI
jgi:hypothetical protein